jgi:hypothetical protein
VNTKAFVAGFALVLPLTFIGAADAAPRNSLTVSNPAPVFGEQVTFTVESNVDRPWVHVQCFQDGKRVYSHTNDYSPLSVTGQVFTLGPTTLWQSGAASCTADLITFKSNSTKWPRPLASTGFEVAP